MRVAFTGVSHWHLPLYLDPVLDLPDATVVGVADPDASVASLVAERIRTRGFSDWRQMLVDVEPEFVFVLGRHIDMPEVCGWLIDHGIPFAVEKPAGIDVASVEGLARRASGAGVFAAVPFVFRQSRWLELIDTVRAGEDPIYLSFTFIAGSIDRYRSGSSWMLDRGLSGGGALSNLGIHFLDLSRLLLGEDVRVASALMSNALDGLEVEDHAAVLLRSEAGASVVETGYIYPAPHMTFDMHFSVRTPRHHFAASDSKGIQVITDGGEPRFHPMSMTNIEYYPVFVRDVLRRVQDGDRPCADLEDMVGSARLLHAAYAASPPLVARSTNSHAADNQVTE